MEMDVYAVVLALVLGFSVLFLLRCPYLLQDCVFVLKFLRIRKKRIRFCQREPIYSLLDCFLDAVRSCPHKPFLLFEDQVWTFLQVDRQSNRAARVLGEHVGLKEGDTAALMVGNEPNFVFLWLGLMKIGCTASLINTNVRGKSLMHCFTCCDAKVIIAGSEFGDAVCEVLPQLRERGARGFVLDGCDGNELQSLRDAMEKSDDAPVSHSLRANVVMTSPALYIYTSGTTGLPKAGIYSQDRVWRAVFYQDLIGVNQNDVIYIPLPLYHAAGMLIGLGGAIERRITVVLRRKFSASQFWSDCRKNNVTVIQYIGEIMRYLCNTPTRDSDRQHSVRLALGNGIRADVWREFQRRFGSVHIYEFYAASDGNLGFINYPRKVGAVGKVNFFHRRVVPHALIQYDAESDEPVRDSRGRCVPVPPGETGLLVSRITAVAPFEGYAGNASQTERKKLRNVFEDGDIYLNSGDLLRMDQHGFIYFQDRVGDTFRWKGENVATTEVADIISTLDFLEDVNVYGVQVPGHEGRVGMAAVTLKENREFDSAQIYHHVTKHLPAYARPRFIRILGTMETTGTFKQVKVSLMRDGFHPERSASPVYVLQENRGQYVPLTRQCYRDIQSGQIRF
ncbi:long-chain fatty acid transport protein 2-like isoform X2 [Trichomycterus rosablanca]|uniref:long-chain fatty acid transport protein 2-like isoform X2 n=1 Tax=Trichomycterus rosablanca TaxID=2290929 RepID=UPI002F35BC98